MKNGDGHFIVSTSFNMKLHCFERMRLSPTGVAVFTKYLRADTATGGGVVT